MFPFVKLRHAVQPQGVHSSNGESITPLTPSVVDSSPSTSFPQAFNGNNGTAPPLVYARFGPSVPPVSDVHTLNFVALLDHGDQVTLLRRAALPTLPGASPSVRYELLPCDVVKIGGNA
jgi:hypothetical protein